MQEIPVYLFTGFLEAGKTKFIQETLEDVRFNNGESTLLLVCEEGVEEYDPSTFSGKYVFIESIDGAEELSPNNLTRLCKKHACERVVIEYNGMWQLDELYNHLPEEWVVYQEFFFADARTFLSFNTNMRSLVVDKLKSCEMVVFNRADEKTPKEEFHKIVRGISRRCDIAYEDAGGEVVYDEIPDELPFDINAPVIQINPEDYAVWYRDISEETEKYQGKTVKLQGYGVLRDKLPQGAFLFGRNVMTCCADDIAFAGLLCYAKDIKGLQDRDWIEITAKVDIRHSQVYGRKGPIFEVQSWTKQEAPEDDLATFY